MKVQNLLLAVALFATAQMQPAASAKAEGQDSAKLHKVHGAKEVHNYKKGMDFSKKYPKAHKFLKGVQAEHHPESKVKIMMSHKGKRLISDTGDAIYWAESELKKLESLLERGEHRLFHYRHTLKVDLNHAKHLKKKVAQAA